MKHILSIDFDIIMEPSISIYNDSVPKTSWDILANTNSYGNILIGNYQTYQILTNYLLKLSNKVPKEKIHFIFDHHDIIQFLDKNEQHYITNIDHHHDLGYPSPECPELMTELNCGNWVNFVPNLQKYFWIKNPNSSLKPDDNSQNINILDFDLDTLFLPDEIYICFSIPWVPPCNHPLFYLWMDVLNKIYNTHFDFEPRTDG